MGARPSKFYSLTFRQIKDIAWDCIIKKQDCDSFSDSWLLKIIKKSSR